MMKRPKMVVLGFLILISFTLSAQKSILPKLERIPGIVVKRLPSTDHFKEVFEIYLNQPVNHFKDTAGHFRQRILFAYKSKRAPVVLNTAGYALPFNNSCLELSQMLDANQIQVEYRYYGRSKPDTMDWRYLTNRQAAEDLHRIRGLFASVLKGKWISTGVSKGGETTLIYRRYFPKDVVASVPYVAPMILGQEDPRTDKHIATVGSPECRQAIKDFQRASLMNREEIIKRIKQYAVTNKIAFSIGVDVAFEYAILEFPFAFWQWGADCSAIPDTDADVQEMFEYVVNEIGLSLYSDKGVSYYEASFYQHLTELGYYGFPHEHLKDLLIAVPNPTNADFAPKNTPLNFNAQFIPEILEWLEVKGNNILYINGEHDTWSACAVRPSDKVNAVRLDVKEGSHSSRIKHLSADQQQKAVKTLKRWLKGCKIHYPENK